MEAIKNKIPTWASFELILIGAGDTNNNPRFNNVLITSQKIY